MDLGSLYIARLRRSRKLSRELASFLPRVMTFQFFDRVPSKVFERQDPLKEFILGEPTVTVKIKSPQYRHQLPFVDNRAALLEKPFECFRVDKLHIAVIDLLKQDCGLKVESKCKFLTHHL